MAILKSLFQLFVAVTAATATPVQRRGTLPNDQIVGLTEVVPNDVTGALYEAYQPYLDVLNGCVPFPAVDVNGNTK
jgi:hypothetical protein